MSESSKPDDFSGDRPLQDLVGNHVYWFLTNRITDRVVRSPGENQAGFQRRQAGEKAKLAERIFCTLRFRKGDNFVDQFRSLFFGTAQWDARTLATALLREPETVKTLTLAALAEQMYVPRESGDTKKKETGK